MTCTAPSFKRMLALLACIGLPIEAQASANTTYSAPYQAPPDGSQLVFMPDSTFHRKDYRFLGGSYVISVAAGQNPDPGDRWTARIERFHPDLGISVLGTVVIDYDGASDCLRFQGAPFFCGVRVADGSPDRRSYFMNPFFDVQCLPAADPTGRRFEYRLGAEYFTNFGVVPNPLPTLPIAFTEFPVGTPELQFASTTLRAKIPAFPAASGGANDQPGLRNPAMSGDEIWVRVEIEDGIRRLDGKNCGQRLPDVPIKIDTRIVPASGGHAHFTNAMEPGKGEFAVDPTFLGPSLSDDKTEIDGKTDATGRFLVRYKAGEFGVVEKIKAEATDTHYGNARTESTEEIRTEIGGLVPMLSDGSKYLIAGTGGPCDTPHNPTPLSAPSRQSHYVTPSMSGRLIELANRYFIGTADASGQNGAMLSFNDASLPLGGFFDDQTGKGKCHVTHRFGVDVDLNRGASLACPNRLNLTCPLNDPAFPPSWTREELLTFLVETDFDGRQMIEGPLHYRFLSAQ
jgi:hypothetical protein